VAAEDVTEDLTELEILEGIDEDVHRGIRDDQEVAQKGEHLQSDCPLYGRSSCSPFHVSLIDVDPNSQGVGDDEGQDNCGQQRSHR